MHFPGACSLTRRRPHFRRSPDIATLRAIPLALVAFLLPAVCAAFGFDDVALRAKQLAASAYKKPDVSLPRELTELTYDQYRDIRYKPERAYWRSAKLPFELMFFHQGLYYNQPVLMHEVSAEGVRDIRFDPENFNYGANRLDPKALQNLGYAGFRVHYSINSPRYKDEVLVFLGASYFRALGRGQRYGLSVQNGTGEWIWRPLVNPKRLLVTSFAVANPLGFGLQQRDRSFASYEDLEARYETRPSVWIEPKGKWGTGRIELVQIPTPDETNDNIVAFFSPDGSPPPQTPYDFEYRMLWQKDNDTRPSLAYVAQTRRGHGYIRKPDDSIAMIVDFEGPVLRKLPADTPVQGVVTADPNIEIMESNAYRNEVTGGWRLALRFKRQDDKKPGELRAFLRSAGATLSETWSYVLPIN